MLLYLAILENLFQSIKVNFPNVRQAFLRSDEAGCYHCNQQQSKILEIEWELQLHVMIFQNPSKESLFVTGALSQESSNKKVLRERP